MYTSISRRFRSGSRRFTSSRERSECRCISYYTGNRNGSIHGLYFSKTTIDKQFSSNLSTVREKSTLQTLQQLVQSGALQSDRAQERVAKRLDRLQTALVDYDNSILFQKPSPSEEEEKSTDKDIIAKADDKGDQSIKRTPKNGETEHNEDNSIPVPTLKIPRGLYVYGNVGTGKTMLMDSFFSNAHVPGDNRKQRFHFHDFLSQIHAKIHRLKQKDLEERGRSFSVDTTLANNPIHKVGLEIASELSLLCLDEFQVTDIADAVILSQLFSVLFQRGTIVVATSNRPPKDLYEGGLNRSYFLPFIDLLERHCITYHIPSDRDYRRILSNCSSFFIPSANGSDKLDSLVQELVEGFTTVGDGNEDKWIQSIELEVGFKRTIVVEKVYNYTGAKDGDDGHNGPSIARFSFEELCDADLGAMDYRAIARAFDIVTLENIPTMDLEGHNRARRFITLIDELYEGKCALMCSTQTVTNPKQLFRYTAGTPTIDRSNDDSSNTKNDDADNIMGVDVAQEGGTPVGALASVRELSFAFERSASRIFEMCSRSWWDRVLGSSAQVEEAKD